MLAGLLGAFALLLGAAGVTKVVAPGATARALRATELPGAKPFSAPLLIRLFGLTESAIAVVDLVLGGVVPAVLLGVTYVLLLAVSLRLLRHAPGQSCGCLGPSSEPVSRWHVAVNFCAVIVATVSAVWPPPTLVNEVTRDGLRGVLLLAAVAALTWMIYLLITALPALTALETTGDVNR